MEEGGIGGSEVTGGGALTEARSNPFGHAPFSGTYRSRLEANGRIVLPSALRAPLVAASAGHLLPRQGRCLLLYTPKGFDAFVDDVVASQGAQAIDPEARQVLFKAAPRVTVDKQARFVVSPDLRAAVGLEGETDIVLAGAIERIEIWDAATYDEVEGPRRNLIDLLLDGYGGLPTGNA